MRDNSKPLHRETSQPKMHSMIHHNLRATAKGIHLENIRPYITVALLLLGLAGVFSLLPYEVVVVGISIFVVLDLIIALDSSPVVLEIAACIAVLQQLFGPWILYEYFNTNPHYRMWVSPEVYFPFAIGGTASFLLALRTALPYGSAKFRLGIVQNDSFRLGVSLIVIGLMAGALVRFGPASFKFFFYLVANLRYVGAIYVYFSENKYRWPIAGLVFFGIYFTATSHGMFHELILWACLGGSYWFVGRRRRLTVKIAAICVGILAVATVQVAKPIFRKQLLYNEDASFVYTVMDLDSDDVLSRKSMENVIIRISQGWIVSAAMYSTPYLVPFGEGSTFIEAMEAALVPRFLIPDKRIASPRDNLHRFTFLRVNEQTQMGIGSLGESWVNFGFYGGCLAMAGFGLLLNSVYRIFCKLSWQNSFFFFCLPIVFLQAVKVETESLTVLNHLVKSSVVIAITYVGLRWTGLIKQKQ